MSERGRAPPSPRSRHSSPSCRSCAACSAGACLYFRDLSLHFFPLRGFALERLRAGEVALLEPLRPRGRAAVAARARLPARPARRRLAARGRCFRCCWPCTCRSARSSSACWRAGSACGRRPPAGGALVYALGGFFLSTVNLYVYVQAAAWAPLVVLTLVRLLDEGGRRAIALAALARGGGALDHGDRDRRPGRRCRPGAGAARQARTGRGEPRRRGAGARRGARRPRAGAARRTGGRQRARARLSDRGRARALRSSLRSRPDPGRRPLRQSREPRERVVGPELLPARLPLRAEPLPRRLDAGARRHRDRRPAAARGSPAAAPVLRPRDLARTLGGTGATRRRAARARCVPLPREGVLHRPPRGGAARRPRPAGARRRSARANARHRRRGSGGAARGDPAPAAGLPARALPIRRGLLSAGVEPRAACRAPGSRAARRRDRRCAGARGCASWPSPALVAGSRGRVPRGSSRLSSRRTCCARAPG